MPFNAAISHATMKQQWSSARSLLLLILNSRIGSGPNGHTLNKGSYADCLLRLFTAR